MASVTEAPSPPPPPPQSALLPFTVGRRRHFAAVTDRVEEAEEWVGSILRLPAEKYKVFGFSFTVCDVAQPDGSVVRRTQSIHLSYRARVLVYYLRAPDEGLCSKILLDFLLSPDTLLVGPSVIDGLRALGLHSCHGMDMREVARICGLSSIMAAAPPPGLSHHAALVGAVLEDMDAGSLLSLDASEPWRWPLSEAQMNAAVQTAVVAQSLGLRAFMRIRRPAFMI